VTVAVDTRAGYDALARFYDAFTAESDYDVWTRNILELAGGLGFSGSTLLDLACGTGKSFLPFLARGFEVTACDVSREMLDEAASKAPGVTLVHSDVRELGAVGRFALVTCFDDALNYLLEEAELSRAFATIAANLDYGGLGLFDLNTLLAYRTTFARDRVTVREDTVFAWRGESTGHAAPGCVAAATLEVFAPDGDERYERARSRHVQRHHPRERVTSLLAEAGLACLGIHGVQADGALEPELDEGRHLKALYAVRRAKGGEPE
jgi:SAM-dependent methyltransferase